MENLVNEAAEMDIEAGGSGGPDRPHVKQLIETICKCGVSFFVWQSKENGKNLAFVRCSACRNCIRHYLALEGIQLSILPCFCLEPRHVIYLLLHGVRSAG